MGNADIKVFKFGGASVKSAQGVENLLNIVSLYNNPLVIVVSAMGKTTSLLERILKYYLSEDEALWDGYKQLAKYHLDIVQELFGNNTNTAKKRVDAYLHEVEFLLKGHLKGDYNFCYDQLVSYGEMMSTSIIAEYFNYKGKSCEFVDVRKVLRSDDTYREGNVHMEISQKLCEQTFTFSKNSANVYVTQGFIAGTEHGATTTLGREGSDYTAAILASLLNSREVTIWKDVDGVLNADPKLFQNTLKLRQVSFKEAIELAYCGAQIMHPKTIKPLQNKGIKLFVKSFLNPTAEGTLVYDTDEHIDYPPIQILKSRQVLVSLTPLDYSFIIEDCFSRIFGTLFKHRVKVNIVQSSAINFTFVVDDEEHFLPGAIKELSNSFAVRFNRGMELLTIRHYSQEVVEELTKGRTVFLQQKTRSTIRLVMATK